MLKNPTRWKYWLVPALIMLILAMLPQANVWLVKGTAWQGAYVVSNYDEVAYSAYVNSLINGRPRKNDSFIATDDSPEHPQNESLYSIQFIPAYTIALPTRLFGFSASTAFGILNFLIPIFSILAIFAFLRAVTKDDLLPAVGSLTALCLGTAIAFEGELQHIFLGNYLCDFFPFLRRYQPGFAFPIFFLFCLFVWRMLTTKTKRHEIIYVVLSGATLVVLIFSYFYLWTAAAAWLACLIFLWLIWRPDERRKTILKTVGIGLFGAGALIPYFLMLTNRQMNMDDVQLLTFTRMPNLTALPEVIGLILTACIFYLARGGKLKLAAPEVLIALSTALTPFILFNQQVVTGRSLQPVHYEIFIANYLLLVGAMIFIWLVLQIYQTSDALAPKLRRGVLYLGVLATVWGFVESTATTRRNAGYESLRDDAMPALVYLRDQQDSEKPLEGRQKYPTVLSQNLMVADFLPTVVSSRALWNPHSNSAGGINQVENKELFYRYLYYSGYTEADLKEAIERNLYEVIAALFGGERALPALGGESKRITRAEFETEIKRYAEFVKTFGATQAVNPTLSYVIVPTKAEPNFKNLDLWYQRDEGKIFGLFKVYRVGLKQ